MKHAILLVVTAAASGLGGYLVRDRQGESGTSERASAGLSDRDENVGSLELIAPDRILLCDLRRGDGMIEVSIRGGDGGSVRIGDFPVGHVITLNPVFTPPAIPIEAFEASRSSPQGK